MRILCLADIHIGSIKDGVYVYNVLKDILDKELVQNKTDAVVLLGDYFHTSLHVNSPHTLVAVKVMSHLIRLCQRRKVKLRIVYGTESHDANQYTLFTHYATADVDMKIIHTATEEELFPGTNVLYLPEEYINDKNETYGKYLNGNKHYTYIFGHGVILEGMTMLKPMREDEFNGEKHVPRFKSGELGRISDITCFGHYHVHTDMGDNVYYVGSLFRNAFGEEADKGYGVIEDDKFIFVKNDKAYTYKTYEFDETSDVYENIDNVIREIKHIKEENQHVFGGDGVGKVRIIFNLPTDVTPEFKNSIRDILSKEPRFQVGYTQTVMEDMEEIRDSIDAIYSFVLDDSLNTYDKLYRYLTINEITPSFSLEELKDYIINPLNI